MPKYALTVLSNLSGSEYYTTTQIVRLNDASSTDLQQKQNLKAFGARGTLIRLAKRGWLTHKGFMAKKLFVYLNTNGGFYGIISIFFPLNIN